MLMSNKGRAARLHYLAATFRMLSPGDHVICAVTRQPIPIGDLRYWSIERQEAYVNAEAAMKAEGRGQEGRGGAISSCVKKVTGAYQIGVSD